MSKDYAENINIENLRIARENTGIDVSYASRRISGSKKNLVSEWESGKALPTWSQAEKLAKLYGVSEFIFFSKERIQENKIIPDYRVAVNKEDNAKVKRLINLVISRQRWLERTFIENGYSKNDIQGTGKKIHNPRELASLISDKLGIKVTEIKQINGVNARKKVLDYLIKRAEEHGVFVGRTISYHKLRVADMRGLFVSNEYCPFIILNRKDAVSAQIFSFIHELAHLFRMSDAISNNLDFRSNSNTSNPEERFCNRVAANLLLPEEDFTSDYYNKDDIKDISEIYKVSEMFIYYRLSELGKIRSGEERNIEKQIKDEMRRNLKMKAKREDEKEGGNYVNLMKNSNGNLFNSVVSNLYFENRIGHVEASNLLRFSPEQV